MGRNISVHETFLRLTATVHPDMIKYNWKEDHALWFYCPPSQSNHHEVGDLFTLPNYPGITVKLLKIRDAINIERHTKSIPRNIRMLLKFQFTPRVPYDLLLRMPTWEHYKVPKEDGFQPAAFIIEAIAPLSLEKAKANYDIQFQDSALK